MSDWEAKGFNARRCPKLWNVTRCGGAPEARSRLQFRRAVYRRTIGKGHGIVGHAWVSRADGASGIYRMPAGGAIRGCGFGEAVAQCHTPVQAQSARAMWLAPLFAVWQEDLPPLISGAADL